MTSKLKDYAVAHAENRLKICIFCIKKKKSFRKLGETVISKLKSHTNYDDTDDRLPQAICSACKINFYKVLKLDNHHLTLASMLPDYAEFTRPTRSSKSSICDCTLCKLVRNVGLFKRKDIDKSPSYQQEIYKGTTHTCNNVENNGNVENNVNVENKGNVVAQLKKQINNSLSPKEREHLICELIKDTKKSKPVDEVNQNNISLSQSHGRPLRIAINQRKNKKSVPISNDDVMKIKTNYSLTGNQIKGIARDFRVAAQKRKLFEPGMREKLTESNHLLDNYFDLYEAELTHVLKDKITFVTKPLVVCEDIKKLCKYVQDERGYEHAHLKIGVDGGGGFLKITLSILNMQRKAQRNIRQKYSDGVAAKRFKDSGVKKLFIVGLVPSTQENYDNIAMLWSMLEIDKLECTIATDLKLANILIGIMAHASNYSCTWCTAKKDDLNQCGEYRTIGNCLKNYKAWQKSGSNKSSANKFKNCVNPPVFSGGHSHEIIDLIPPPELHLLTGIVNKLYDHMLLEYEEDAVKWAKMCHVKRKVTCGFVGNSCNTLLKKTDTLSSFCDVGCLKYVECFENFRNVVESCFSEDLKENYEIQITKFKLSYLDLNISVTPKVHAVFFHVPYFCSKTNKGLGVFSEQATESAHRDFNETWLKYKVNDEHPDYNKRLLKAVCEYNSHHI